MREFDADKKKDTIFPTRHLRSHDIDWAEARIRLAILRYEILGKNPRLRITQQEETPAPDRPRPHHREEKQTHKSDDQNPRAKN